MTFAKVCKLILSRESFQRIYSVPILNPLPSGMLFSNFCLRFSSLYEDNLLPATKARLTPNRNPSLEQVSQGLGYHSRRPPGGRCGGRLLIGNFVVTSYPSK